MPNDFSEYTSEDDQRLKAAYSNQPHQPHTQIYYRELLMQPPAFHMPAYGGSAASSTVRSFPFDSRMSFPASGGTTQHVTAFGNGMHPEQAHGFASNPAAIVPRELQYTVRVYAWNNAPPAFPSRSQQYSSPAQQSPRNVERATHIVQYNRRSRSPNREVCENYRDRQQDEELSARIKREKELKDLLIQRRNNASNRIKTEIKQEKEVEIKQETMQETEAEMKEQVKEEIRQEVKIKREDTDWN